MAFTLDGSMVTQTGTDIAEPNSDTLLSTVGLGFFTVIANEMYSMQSGEVFRVSGTFTDTTGRFNLLMEAGSKFEAESGGLCTIGKVTGSGVNSVYEGGGIVTVIPTNQGGWTPLIIGYGANTSNTTNKMQFYGSTLNLYSKHAYNSWPNDMFFSGISGSRVNGIDQTGTGDLFLRVRLAPNSHFSDNVVTGISGIEFHGPSTFERNVFTNLKDSFVSFDTGAVIDIPNTNFNGTLNGWGWISNGGLNYINAAIEGDVATNAQIESKQGTIDVRGHGGNNLPAADRKIRFSKSQKEYLEDEAGSAIAADDIVVWYKNNDSDTFTPTITAGVYEQEILLKQSNNDAGSGGWQPHDVTYDNYYPIDKFVGGYKYQLSGETFAGYDDFAVIGTGTAERRLVKTDGNVSETDKTIVDAYTYLNTSAQIYDGNKFWKFDSAANYQLPTLGTLPLTRVGGTINSTFPIVLDETATDLFDFDGTTITIKSDTFTGDITSTGDITVDSSTTIGDGASFAGTVYLNSAQNLTDVTIDGDLRIATGANSTLDFSNVTVTGSVWNDSASNTLTINATNSSSLSAGDDGDSNGQTDIQAAAPITVTVLDTSNVPIENASVQIVATETVGTITTGDQIYKGLTNALGVISTTINYEGAFDPSGLDIKVKARQGSVSPYKVPASILGVISSTGFAATITMQSDE